MPNNYYWLLLALWLTSGWLGVRGQGYNNNWYFGTQAGLTFSSGTPAPLTNGQLTSYEGCASISDATGTLQAYSHGVTIWNRSHQPMPNGTGMGGHESASQACMFLPYPGQPSKFVYLIVDAIDNNLVYGLRYSVLDMTLQNGLGDVTATKNVRLPTPTLTGKVTEKLTAALHANGRDYWIIVKGWQNNEFYSFLLSPSGVSSTPVISAAGPVHQGGGSFFGAGNAVGCMRVSPDGQWLALAQRDNEFALHNFNNATGVVSNYVRLGAFGYNYGVEFSPNSSRLYCAASPFGSIGQYNLQAGALTQIAASRVTIYSGDISSLQRGPDGKIYGAMLFNGNISVIDNPDALGTACNLRVAGVPLGGRQSQNGLPNYPNAFARNVVLSIALTATPACLPSPFTFVGTASGFVTGSTYTWNFGDPTSGAANTATGLTASHVFSGPGTYTVTLLGTSPDGTASATQTVTAAAPPAFSLGRDTTVCLTQPFVLRPTPAQPGGTTYRWQDGSTGATYAAALPGIYSVEITRNGCSSRDEIIVTGAAAPSFSLGPDTLVCLEKPLVLRPRAAQPAGSTYRWQDGSTAATFTVTEPGTYWLEISRNGSCSGRDEISVGNQCPVVIPNIITPDDGDQLNQTFKLKGLIAAEWSLEIYNRWGREVYQVSRYDNSWSADKQPAGVYYYHLRHNATGQMYRGWVKVMR
ncbi:T9SS type B sorting domain-containing protein [Hymenobacter jeollabukensis]|uniref:PKD domain-containing protein n=1 Tax=Hymenobacter jeollabukensis TaxID=2025313 RepID=A0A5R8WWB3_9BACT|nr:gliding motility-associated C-terminal domain-containing protein [Hymenobacter jeollabukensis]TLM96821.1 PKD domain-containing protein [Hymenobacter jeollabukensis]